jgi:hypothetical protein
VAQGEGPEFKPQHWKKKKFGMVVYVCHLSYVGDCCPGKLRQKKVKPYLKTDKSKKRAGAEAQVIEHLPSKQEALSSNRRTTPPPKKF